MTLHVILNPNASDRQKRSRVRKLRRALDGSDYHFCPRAFDSHLWLVRERAQAGERHEVLAVGGDGTVNRLLPYLTDSPVGLAILPAGTANDLASSLCLPSQTDAAIEVMRAGVRAQIDVIEVNGRKFVTSGGVGLAADAAKRANHWKRKSGLVRCLSRMLGSTVYPIAAASLLSREHDSLWVSTDRDHDPRAIRGLTVLFCNLQRLGKRFEPAPGASPRDGVVDLCVVREPKTFPAACRILLRSLFGGLHRLPEVGRARARQVLVHSQEPLAFFGDGEILTENRDFALTVLPRALTVFVPRWARAA